ncbi:Leucine rich repeat-containing protein [Ruminococcaceae bacterium YRB3002]|nr:Leucine rich repeat-containing protein [Ruminococcaceae bacterium YRB3002]
MPIVQAKCTNCSANLQIDSGVDAAVCPFCGTPYIVEKAINYYNTTNNINAGVVNLYGTVNRDYQIRGGVLEKYNGESTEIVIPASVTIIGAGAFAGCIGITSVSFPESVTEIGEDAFISCHRLRSLTIPGNVKIIGKGSFRGCSGLTEVVIGDGVQMIMDGAFLMCQALTEITLPASLSYIGSRVFAHCSALRSCTLPEGITHIDRLFEGCTHLSRVVVPESLRSAERRTFEGCVSLKELTGSAGWRVNNRGVLVSFALDGARMIKGMEDFSKCILNSIASRSSTTKVLVTKVLQDDFYCYPLHMHNQSARYPAMGRFGYDPRKTEAIRTEMMNFLYRMGITKATASVQEVPVFYREGNYVTRGGMQPALVVTFMFEEDRLRREADARAEQERQAQVDAERAERSKSAEYERQRGVQQVQGAVSKKNYGVIQWTCSILLWILAGFAFFLFLCAMLPTYDKSNSSNVAFIVFLFLTSTIVGFQAALVNPDTFAAISKKRWAAAFVKGRWEIVLTIPVAWIVIFIICASASLIK